MAPQPAGSTAPEGDRPQVTPMVRVLIFLDEHFAKGMVHESTHAMLKHMVVMIMQIGAKLRELLRLKGMSRLNRGEGERPAQCVSEIVNLAKCIVEGSDCVRNYVKGRKWTAEQVAIGLPGLSEVRIGAVKMAKGVETWRWVMSNLHQVNGNEARLFGLMIAHYDEQATRLKALFELCTTQDAARVVPKSLYLLRRSLKKTRTTCIAIDHVVYDVETQFIVECEKAGLAVSDSERTAVALPAQDSIPASPITVVAVPASYMQSLSGIATPGGQTSAAPAVPETTTELAPLLELSALGTPFFPSEQDRRERSAAVMALAEDLRNNADSHEHQLKPFPRRRDQDSISHAPRVFGKLYDYETCADILQLRDISTPEHPPISSPAIMDVLSANNTMLQGLEAVSRYPSPVLSEQIAEPTSEGVQSSTPPSDNNVVDSGSMASRLAALAVVDRRANDEDFRAWLLDPTHEASNRRL